MPLIEKCTPSTGGATGVIPNFAITNPEKVGFCDFMALASNVLGLLLNLVFWVALGFIVYAAFIWLTSMGNPGKVKAASAILRNIVIGLIIIFSAKAILSLFFLAFGVPSSFLPW